RLLVAGTRRAQVPERRLSRRELGRRFEHAVRRDQHLDDFLARGEEVADVWPADQAEPLDLPWIDRREDLSDPAAEGLAGDDRLVDPDLLEEQVQVLGVLLRRVVAVRSPTVAVPPLIEAVHVEPRAEGIARPFPHATV